MTRYWIVVASRDHAKAGEAGGFVQACHGKQGPVSRMQAGDWVTIYSPRLHFERSEPCQAFTALGQVSGQRVYPYDMGNGFVPYRRDVDFRPVTDQPVRPLIDNLGFISNKRHWGAAFRYGLVGIPEADFQLIAERMRAWPIS